MGSHLVLVYVDTREVTSDWLVEAAYEGHLLNLLPSDTLMCNVKPVIAIGPVATGSSVPRRNTTLCNCDGLSVRFTRL